MLKIQRTELMQAVDELAVLASGLYGGVQQLEAVHPLANVEPVGPAELVTAMPRYLNNRAGSIYGGSNEVQRNIIAKGVLGL
jgi:acyl-CoA dehydrogenase